MSVSGRRDPRLAQIYAAARKHRRALEKRNADASEAMYQAWRTVLEDLRPRIDAITQRIDDARKAGETVNPAWLYQQARYRELLDASRTRFNQYAQLTEQVATGLQAFAATEAIDAAYYLVRGAFGPNTADTPVVLIRPGAEELKDIVGFLGDGSPLRDLLATFGDQAAEGIGKALTAGIVTGQSPIEIARAIRKAAGIPRTRAETIARTELHRAFRTATQRTFEANADVISGWIWHSAQQRRTCAACWAMHGTFHPVSEMLRGHVRCVPAGTVVTSSRVEAATSRWFDGDLIEIGTASGSLLSITPNHPILTPRGWIPAHFLNKGDDVISSIDAQRVATAIYPDNDGVPSLIEQVAESVGNLLGSVADRVPSSPEDFHGDGGRGDIDIVRSYGLLSRNGESPINQPLSDQRLCRRHAKLGRLAFDSGATSGLEAIRPSALSIVSGASIGDVLLPSPSGHQGSIDFRTSSDIDAGSPQKITERFAGDPLGAGELIWRLSGLVTRDQIVSIRRYPFRGHVYNLETSSGYYTAANIIVHNCRCAMLPQTKTWEELGIKGVQDERVTVPLGADLFAQLSARDQRFILGKTKYDMFKAGDITLPDLATLHKNPVWGDSWQEATIKQAREAAEARQNAAKRALTASTRPKTTKAPKDQGSAPTAPDFKPGAQVRAEIEAYGRPLFDQIKQLESQLPRLAQEANDAYKVYESYGYGPDRQRIYDEWGKKFDAYTRAKVDVAERTEKLRSDILERWLYTDPATFKVNGAPRKANDRSSSEQLERSNTWEKGIDSLRRLVGTGHVDDKEITYYRKPDEIGPDGKKRPGRAHQYGNEIHIGSPAHGYPGRVIVHEIGHWIEQESPGAHQEIVRHFQARTAGETPTKLKDIYPTSNYRDDEYTKRDKWISLYSGKEYVGNSEILSMTLEQIHTDPFDMINQDPDTFDLVWRMLRSKNLPPKTRRRRS